VRTQEALVRIAARETRRRATVAPTEEP